MAELNAREQLFLELMNRARMDPAGEAARYGLADLNTGLPAGTITAAPKQVLAPNALLTDAAKAHSQWMIDSDVFDHAGVGGTTPGQRMTNAGYAFTGSWTWGENIAWSGTTGTLDANAMVLQEHRGLFLSAGHRDNILNGAFKEAGVGALTGQFTPGTPDPNTYNALMTTEDFAKSGNKVFVSGVTYNDTDNNNFYSIGEGVGGRTFELLSGTTVLGSAAGMAAGGYAIGVTASGAVELHVTGAGLGADIGVIFNLGSSNVKVDLTDGNTVEANVSALLSRATANLTLLGIENIAGAGNSLGNIITGNFGHNALSGGAGNDTLIGGSGNDTLDGGAGVDIADYRGATGGVVVELWRALASNDGQGGADSLPGIEGVYGTPFADTLVGDSGDNVFRGGAGADGLYGGSGSDTADYRGASAGIAADLAAGYAVDGQGSVDFLNDIENVAGSAFNDYLSGSAASNSFKGGAGNDSFVGGAGVDTGDYSSAAVAVAVDLAAQFAFNDGQGGIDFLVGIENLIGSAFGDYFSGNSADNSFRGGAGSDTMNGGAGSDTADYGDANAAVTANLTTASANDGQGGADFLTGMENLVGSVFGDSLIGDANGNTISGAGGNDFMMGAGGADGFVFGAAAGADTITDFSKAQGDKLFLQSNLNGSGITTGAQALAHAFDAGGTAIVDLGGGNSIALLGVNTATLAASDFVIF